MDMSRMEHLSQVANQDPEFRIHTRFWNTALRLDMGDNAVLIRIKDGEITEVKSGRYKFDLLETANIHIEGPADGWEKFLELVPKPFYVDLWGATAHHGFTVSGEMESFYAYYPAIRRLFDIMRTITHAA
jgi:hypothetical protein